jgi:ABC-type polar amino acid transport system ATPase subunit
MYLNKYVTLALTVLMGLSAAFTVLPYGWAHVASAAMTAFVGVTSGAYTVPRVISGAQASRAAKARATGARNA